MTSRVRPSDYSTWMGRTTWTAKPCRRRPPLPDASSTTGRGLRLSTTAMRCRRPLRDEHRCQVRRSRISRDKRATGALVTPCLVLGASRRRPGRPFLRGRSRDFPLYIRADRRRAAGRHRDSSPQATAGRWLATAFSSSSCRCRVPDLPPLPPWPARHPRGHAVRAARPPRHDAGAVREPVDPRGRPECLRQRDKSVEPGSHRPARRSTCCAERFRGEAAVEAGGVRVGPGDGEQEIVSIIGRMCLDWAGCW